MSQQSLGLARGAGGMGSGLFILEQGRAVLSPSPALGRGPVLLWLLCMAQARGEQGGLVADVLCHPSEMRFAFLSDRGSRC